MGLIYTGIGSRETPEKVQQFMAEIGQALGAAGWTLRSGFADGADNAFARGAELSNDGQGGVMELYLPWPGFNKAPMDDPRFIWDYDMQTYNSAAALAAAFHPYWSDCSQGAKRLHIRNGFQVLGADLRTPTNCVICWTKDGKATGGTGQALRIAKNFGIPIFNLKNEADIDQLQLFLKQWGIE